MIDLKQFFSAMATIEEEKGIPHEVMVDTIETAIATAYKKDYGEKGQIIRAVMDQDTGSFKLFQDKIVVDESVIKTPEEIEAERLEQEKAEEEGRILPEPDPDEPRKVRFNPERHLMIEDAKKEKKGVKVEDVISYPLEYKDDFGRIAVQTAKQVILQKIREAERSVVYDEFNDKIDTIISGTVQRVERGYVYFDIGKATGIMAPKDAIPGEYYRVGMRLRLYLIEVDRGSMGIQILVSRSHPKMLARLFELEVPEIGSGALEIKALAREAGSRSKIAVYSNEEGVDPIGSCVGQRGTRVAAVIQELGGEKIDIIEWSDNPEEFIGSALSPARVLSVDLEEDRASVVVADDQLSLAIGRDGQNVRLAAKLTGWKIDVVSKESGQIETSSEQDQDEQGDEQEPSEQEDSAKNAEEQDADQQEEDNKEQNNENSS